MALRLPTDPGNIGVAVGRYVERAGIREASTRPLRLLSEALFL